MPKLGCYGDELLEDEEILDQRQLKKQYEEFIFEYEDEFQECQSSSHQSREEKEKLEEIRLLLEELRVLNEKLAYYRNYLPSMRKVQLKPILKTSSLHSSKTKKRRKSVRFNLNNQVQYFWQ